MFKYHRLLTAHKNDAFIKKIEKDAYINLVEKLDYNFVTKFPYLFPEALFTEGEGDIINEKDPTTFQNIVFVKKNKRVGQKRSIRTYGCYTNYF